MAEPIEIQKAIEAAETALSHISRSHQLAILARMLGSVACLPGPDGHATEMLTAHCRLGQAAGIAFDVVAKHFRGVD